VKAYILTLGLSDEIIYIDEREVYKTLEEAKEAAKEIGESIFGAGNYQIIVRRR